jgi:ectoine hydroxylase-related dioxygenase (phytanoyl-CoA dioxygenase family)
VTFKVQPGEIETFQRDGAVCLRAVFADWVAELRRGVERNETDPGPYVADNVPEGAGGRFWDDYCNWDRIAEFRRFAFESDAATVAAALMGSRDVQLFHDHVLVKEPCTDTETPWHSDRPYYLVDGRQTVSFWVPLDPIAAGSSLRVIAGSQHWEQPLEPTRWLSGEAFYRHDPRQPRPYRSLSELGETLDAETILAWDVEPGDAVAFDFGVVHSAAGNPTASRRRVFSLRLVGDDARVVQRPGRTSPPFPDHGMVAGDRLRPDWFPYLPGPVA